MLRTIIIEDEENIKISLEKKLEKHCPNVKVTGWSDNVKDSIKLINDSSPDLVLLDIKLPDGTGFDILRALKNINFNIIFITAYNDYATDAFKFSALDYLLKPVRAEDLVNAVEKAEKALSIQNIEERLNILYENLESIIKSEKKIVLNTAENIQIIEIKDIVRCESDGNYTNFYLKDGTKLLVSKTLKEFDEILTGYRFFRPHKSHLINLSYLKSYEKTEGGYLKMKDGTNIPLSMRKKSQLLEVLGDM